MAVVECDVVDAVATVTLNRPEALNAFNDAVEAELIAALDRCDSDDAVRVVILTGAGSAFCAGADLAKGERTFAAWRSSSTAPPGTQFEVGDRLPLRRDGGGRVVLRLFAMRKPVIAAINGHAIGGGATITLAADFRLAAENARFGFVFTRRGVVPESCSSWFLPRLVPVATALDWILTGRIFMADEALHAGLVRSLHSRSELLAAARTLAEQIAQHTSPTSVALARQLIWRGLTAEHPMFAHQIETVALNVRGVSADAEEGIASFLDKRAARFTDEVPTDLSGIFAPLGDPVYRPPHAVQPESPPDA